MMMKCIFCLKINASSIEHVFPLAIGGTITTDRVCVNCNSQFGNKIDAALIDNFLVRGRRAHLGLAGNSGKPPAIHEFLLGVWKLADDPNMRVETTFNETTGRPDMRVLYHASDVRTPEGTQARRIILDANDADQIPKIIQRERRRHGVPLLSPEQLAAEMEKWAANISTIENPTILIERYYSFEFVRHAIIKIAYELAFLWLGEQYLDDPSAAEIRAALCASTANSTDHLPAYVQDNGESGAFNLWQSNDTHHLAYAFVNDDGIAIAVRIFDIYAAFVWVTKDYNRYLSGPDANAKIRFLSIDPSTGQTRNVLFSEEMLRIASEKVARRRSGA